MHGWKTRNNRGIMPKKWYNSTMCMKKRTGNRSLRCLQRPFGNSYEKKKEIDQDNYYGDNTGCVDPCKPVYAGNILASV